MCAPKLSRKGSVRAPSQTHLSARPEPFRVPWSYVPTKSLAGHPQSRIRVHGEGSCLPENRERDNKFQDIPGWLAPAEEEMGKCGLPHCLCGQWAAQGLCSVVAFTMEQLSTANTHFAVDLFRSLNKDNPTGNIFISPLSISSALAMIFLGTRGNTAAQVSKVSRNEQNQPAFSCVSLLMSSLN